MLVGETDLLREHPSLHVAGRVVVVVVEPALAHGHDAGLAEQLGAGRRARGRVVRVQADGGPHDLGVTSSSRHRVGRAGAVGPDRDEAVDAGGPGVGHHGVDEPDVDRPVTLPPQVAVIVGPAQRHGGGP